MEHSGRAGSGRLPVEKSRKLNERHYGALQGLNKAETAEKYGDEQVKQWRRGFAVTPPELSKDDERYPGHDPRYAKLTEAELPQTESPALTIDRVVPYWNETILPRLKSGERVIIAAHGNPACAGEIRTTWVKMKSSS